MILTTDASDYGYGAVLEQLDDHERLRPLAYYSKCYTSAQRNYSVTEKELLSIVMSIEHFHCYLFGKHFQVFCDHKPLSFLPNKKNAHSRLERWLMRLSIYKFTITYKEGANNVIADFLSRLPDPTSINTNTEDDYLGFLVATLCLPLSYQDDIAQEQKNDPDIVWLINIKKTFGDLEPVNVKPHNHVQSLFLRYYINYRLLNETLLKEEEDFDGDKRSLLVLPSQCLAKVFQMAHASPK